MARSHNTHLHLHRFENDEAVALMDLLAHFAMNRKRHRGRRSPHHTAFVAGYPMRYSIDFDQVPQSIHHRDDPMSTAATGQPRFERSSSIQLNLGTRTIDFNTK